MMYNYMGMIINLIIINLYLGDVRQETSKTKEATRGGGGKNLK